MASAGHDNVFERAAVRGSWSAQPALAGPGAILPPASERTLDDMAPVPGGRFLMGSERFYREERPLRPVEVGPFLIDRRPCTNAQFARFVDATGYLTLAERAPDPAGYPDADPELLVP